MPNNRGMTRWIAALALALAACASETRYVEPAGQDDEALRTYAADAWSTVGVEAPEDYKILFLDPETLRDACNVDAASPPIGGCSFPGVVLLSTEVSSCERQQMRLIHELGHLMRPGHKGELDHVHLDCPESHGSEFVGNDVMCFMAAADGTFPTERDAAFVHPKG